MKNKLILWVVVLCMAINFQSCAVDHFWSNPPNEAVVSYLHNNLDESILVSAKFYPVCSDTTGALVAWSDTLILIKPDSVEQILDYTMFSYVDLYWADDTVHIATHSCSSEDYYSILNLVETPSDFKNAELVKPKEHENFTILGIKSDRYSLDSFDFNYYTSHWAGERCQIVYDLVDIECAKSYYERSCPGYAVIKYYELDLSADCFKR